MKLDSRDKKPKIYSLAVLGAAAILALALMALSGNSRLLLWGNAVLALAFGAAVVLLLDAFRKQLQYNLYSYNTILYAGFGLFTFFLFATHLTMAIRSLLHPDQAQAMQMLYTLVHSAKNYMLITSPFMLLFSLALFVSNLALIRHEGRRFVNILGILLALALLAGELLIAVLDLYSAFSEREVLARNLTVNLMAAFYLYFACMIVGAITADWIAARYVADADKDYLIVLGCGLRKDGAPTPLLKGRLDLALAFDRRQREQSGREALFVVSGGQGPDEVQSEAASMRAYLLERGIAPERIVVEDRSTDTAENMRFSKEKIDAIDPAGKVAFFTTNYHVFRAGLKARQVKLRAVGMGAPTKWYFWPNAAVREFAGLLTEHLDKQLLVLGLLAVLYTALTVLAYSA